MSVLVPQMTGTALSRNLGIPAFGGNPTSYVQDDGRNNTSPVLPNWKPWPDLGPDGHDPVLGAIAN